MVNVDLLFAVIAYTLVITSVSLLSMGKYKTVITAGIIVSISISIWSYIVMSIREPVSVVATLAEPTPVNEF